MNKRCCFPPKAPRGGVGRENGPDGARGACPAPHRVEHPHPAPQPDFPRPSSSRAGRNSPKTRKTMGTPDRAPSLPFMEGDCLGGALTPSDCLIRSPSPPFYELSFFLFSFFIFSKQILKEKD